MFRKVLSLFAGIDLSINSLEVRKQRACLFSLEFGDSYDSAGQLALLEIVSCRGIACSKLTIA